MLVALLALLPLFAVRALAQTCNATSLCPALAPCCSEYGYCGTGTYCIQGCEPAYSYQVTSCRPDPICQSGSTDFTGDLSRVLTNGSAYDGNATAYDWIVNTGTLVPSTNGVRLTLAQNNSGTEISSTRYIHYGTINFVLEASGKAGVVTAAITMSDVKDEIDWEWPGVTGKAAQTNYWYLGQANYSATEGQGVQASSDTASNFHNYSLNWQEDRLDWLIDGTVVRTVLQSDTCASGTCKYPKTPSRIQISIWPAGIPTEAQGTIDWAGGMIDWTDSDYVANGYFYNTLQSVQVDCAADASQDNATTGWTFSEEGYSTDNSTLSDLTVVDSNASTLVSAGARTSPESPLTGMALLFALSLGSFGLGMCCSFA